MLYALHNPTMWATFPSPVITLWSGNCSYFQLIFVSESSLTTWLLQTTHARRIILFQLLNTCNSPLLTLAFTLRYVKNWRWCWAWYLELNDAARKVNFWTLAMNNLSSTKVPLRTPTTTSTSAQNLIGVSSNFEAVEAWRLRPLPRLTCVCWLHIFFKQKWIDVVDGWLMRE